MKSKSEFVTAKHEKFDINEDDFLSGSLDSNSDSEMDKSPHAVKEKEKI